MCKKMTTRDVFIIGLISQVLIMILGISALAQTMPQLNAKSEEMKNRIIAIGTGGDLTITNKSGQEFYGSVKDIKTGSVSINEVDLKRTVEIDYDEIKKIDKGYGQHKGFNGKRIAPRKHLIGIILATAAILIPVAILVSAKD